jgi:hypothetical protein
MKVLKVLGTIVCSILLFLALSILSVAFLLNSTVLSPDFMNKQIDKLDTSEITQDLIDDQLAGELPQESEFLLDVVISVIEKESPLIKAQVNSAIDDSYAYFLGDTDTLELTFSLAGIKQDLKSNMWDVAVAFLKDTLANMNEAEVDAYVEKIAEQIPVETLPAEIAALPPSMRDEIVKQYLKELGGRSEYSSINFEVDVLIEAQVRSSVEQYFNDYLENVPDSYTVDESTLGTDTMNSLRDVRKYISYFKMAYIWLIIFVIVMAGLIFLINWNDIKASMRSLGIDLLIFGILNLVGVLVLKSLSLTGMIGGFSEMPVSMQDWAEGVITDVTGIMMIFSIIILAAGVILTVASFFVKKQQTGDSAAVEA